MAFVSYDELPVYGLDSNSDNRGKVKDTAKRQLRLIGNDPANDDEAAARIYLGTLGIFHGAAHPRLGTAYRCRGISVNRSAQLTWDANLTYRTPEFDQNDPDPNNAYPWDQPTKVDYFDVSETGPVEEDVNGDPIATVNNEQYEGLTREYEDVGISLKRAFLTFTGPSYYTYRGRVNSDEFLGFPAGTLRITSIVANEADHDGQKYYDVTVKIAARKPIRTTDDKAWYLRVLHQGYYVRAAANDPPERATVRHNEYAVKPVYLDDDGLKLADGATPVWKEYEIYESVAFSGMNFF